MPERKGKHLGIESREAIERGIAAGDSARRIAKAIGVAPSTVTREVLANRTVREVKARKGANLAVRCARYRDCHASGTACGKCSTRLAPCKACRTRSCIESCPDFERKMCPKTVSWPYVCPEGCPRRAYCGYPKCSYSAGAAEAAYRRRLSESRSGIACTEEQPEGMRRIVAPLVKKGHSFEAIWAVHGGELPVCARTAYNYQEAGVLGVPSIELPRKVRLRPRRRKAASGRSRVDRSGREYSDFAALPLPEQAGAVQGDSVCGHEGGARDLLSLHLVACKFQFYLPKDHGSPEAVVGWLDHIERTLGSPEAFAGVFGVMLLDRGVEFDDWEGMERSCLEGGAHRCRVFYCDAMRSDQKAEAERNHEQLRRILPKGRSDFDAISVYDAAVITSHVNSYVGGGRGGACPFDLAEPLLPKGLLEELGIEKVDPDDVVLRPSLVPHVVAR
ncbi:hypothetical protein DMP06_01595 [Slackia equolifaciens]|uniref:Transposase IS30-like HTH domain-containing protein n=1 Tax=Slackia equolifaciens TaxID=498718 RepID=A0A3N0B5M9_9ACTN|nr:helix-turn-helix domain-containing protein [Slackia equolifaciens]RNL42124.1 hypothetical protein DMP06_01595 [Slackia equolifaciens]